MSRLLIDFTDFPYPKLNQELKRLNDVSLNNENQSIGMHTLCKHI